ncbi:hypothetical protein MPL3365_180060 [Mesorhizobium plurifarium]|uniref:Uncharacterized protein n=1 Tax=Mesorhizobium plurifarium TaxID=69974 RepID=A0A090G6L6_MESPL|nr:hypothetical protein MPL3365_180060 [Mesorhizobium plurifarium]
MSQVFSLSRGVPRFRSGRDGVEDGLEATKLGGFREPERSVLKYVSAGSAGSRDLQAGLT